MGVRVGVENLWALEWAWQMGVRVGVANLDLLDQSIGIDETNTYKLKFCIWHENCGRHRFMRFVGA